MLAEAAAHIVGLADVERSLIGKHITAGMRGFARNDTRHRRHREGLHRDLGCLVTDLTDFGHTPPAAKDVAGAATKRSSAPRAVVEMLQCA
jgi:hypothetical protein